MSDIKVGGYGPDGCTCAIQAFGCPVHDNPKRQKAHGTEIELLKCEHCSEFGVVADAVRREFICMKCGKSATGYSSRALPASPVGAREGQEPLCRRCGLPDVPNHEFGFRDHAMRWPDDCLTCDGRGWSGGYDCKVCNGTGKATAPASVGAGTPPQRLAEVEAALTSESVCHWLRGNGFEGMAESIETGEQLYRIEETSVEQLIAEEESAAAPVPPRGAEPQEEPCPQCGDRKGMCGHTMTFAPYIPEAAAPVPAPVEGLVAQLDELLTCQHDAPHYCPNCGKSRWNDIRELFTAALAASSAPRTPQERLSEDSPEFARLVVQPLPTHGATSPWTREPDCPLCGEPISDSPDEDFPANGTMKAECEHCQRLVNVTGQTLYLSSPLPTVPEVGKA